jgi:hypothetical protein
MPTVYTMPSARVTPIRQLVNSHAWVTIRVGVWTGRAQSAS